MQVIGLSVAGQQPTIHLGEDLPGVPRHSNAAASNTLQPVFGDANQMNDKSGNAVAFGSIVLHCAVLYESPTANRLNMYLTDATAEATFTEGTKVSNVGLSTPHSANGVGVIDCDPKIRRFVTGGLKFAKPRMARRAGRHGPRSTPPDILYAALANMCGIGLGQTRGVSGPLIPCERRAGAEMIDLSANIPIVTTTGMRRTVA
jgi:hypothetical protein